MNGSRGSKSFPFDLDAVKRPRGERAETPSTTIGGGVPCGDGAGLQHSYLRAGCRTGSRGRVRWRTSACRCAVERQARGPDSRDCHNIIRRSSIMAISGGRFRILCKTVEKIWAKLGEMQAEIKRSDFGALVCDLRSGQTALRGIISLRNRRLPDRRGACRW